MKGKKGNNQYVVKIPISDECVAILEDNHRRFVEKFGREPLPTEPLFCDPDFDVPTAYTEKKLRAICIQAAKDAGLDVIRFLYTLGFEVG
jgi:hypothetical protein